MKKIIFAVSMAVLLSAGISAGAKDKKNDIRKVVYCTTIDCDHCVKKVNENIAFEKGVKGLKVSLPTKTVEIVFDSAKTDTLKLRKAINKLGYEAKVVEYKNGK